MLTRFCSAAIVLAGFCLSACSTLPTPLSPNGPATTAYIQGRANEIVEYSAAASGGSPSGILTPPLSYSFCSAVATDEAGQLYVFASDGAPNYKILIYPPNSTGTANPLRTVDINISSASAFAVGPSGLLYVFQAGENGGTSVTVYSIGSSEAVPLHTLQVSTIETPQDVAVDGTGNIYVVGSTTPAYNSSPYAIEVYSATATGTDAPVRSIGSSAQLYGVAVDAAGHIFANVMLDDGRNCAIEEFGADADGVVAPINTITLPQQTADIVSGGPVRLDAAGNVFVSVRLITFDSPTQTYVVYGFASDSTGHATPTVQITPSTTDVITIAFAVN